MLSPGPGSKSTAPVNIPLTNTLPAASVSTSAAPALPNSPAAGAMPTFANENS
jgi:hypothetical protein